MGLDQIDVDSTPDNGTGQVVEDDEASVTVTISNSIGSRSIQIGNGTSKMEIFELSPNPANDFTRLPINSDVELQTEVYVSDISGRIIETSSVNIICLLYTSPSPRD